MFQKLLERKEEFKRNWKEKFEHDEKNPTTEDTKEKTNKQQKNLSKDTNPDSKILLDCIGKMFNNQSEYLQQFFKLFA